MINRRPYHLQQLLIIVTALAAAVVTWTPQKSRAAQAENQVVYAAGASEHAIYIMNADGSDPRKLTTAGDNIDPAWSPDRRTIVFSSSRDSSTEIFTINADSSGEKQLTKNNGTANVMPVWSPDGQYIAFISNRPGRNSLFIMKADGSGITQVNKQLDGDYSDPAWSPDGKKIVYANNATERYELWSVNTDGSSPRQLSHNTDGDYSDPAWSVDGKKIAYVGILNGNGVIFSMDANGGAGKKLAEMPEQFVGATSWSPDGASVLFVAWKSDAPHIIYTVPAAGGTPQPFVSNLVDAGWPSWASFKAGIGSLALTLDAAQPEYETRPPDPLAPATDDSEVAEIASTLTAAKPRNAADANKAGSVWKGVNFKLLTTPHEENYDTTVQPGNKLRFAFNWCSDGTRTINAISRPLIVGLFVDSDQIPDDKILIFDQDNCRKWTTLLSGWKAGDLHILRIKVKVREEIPFRKGTVDEGNYVHRLNVTVTK